MTSTKIVCFFLIILNVTINKIVGIYSTESFSLNPFPNKQNVKTIKARYGDMYDCVDFYEQPAFKHPKLKNHKYYPEMRPNYVPNITTTRKDIEEPRIHALENGGCPIGKVPIRRLSKEEHFRASMFSETHNVTFSELVAPPGTHFAILQTKASPNPPHYYGVGGTISIWNPEVKGRQYSAARLTIQNGPESLQVGWMVNPTMFKDTLTHMFVHTNAGDSNCYNTYCPGFVVVRSDMPPGITCRRSIRRKIVYAVEFFIYRDTISGDWWLLLEKIPIGFWPGRIFNSLNNFGTYISCGGETYSPPDQAGGYPQMGSGVFPLGAPKEDTFIKYFRMVNEKLQPIDVQDAEKYVDTKKYNIYDIGITKSDGRICFFGGYGG